LGLLFSRRLVDVYFGGAPGINTDSAQQQRQHRDQQNDSNSVFSHVFPPFILDFSNALGSTLATFLMEAFRRVNPFFYY
jgi:hypothetical protein